MGSSFTKYRGAGFWTRDASIELWLYLLSEEVHRLDDPPAWLQEAAEDWHIQATVGMGGCVSAGLDRHAPAGDRAAVVLELAERALAGLRARGEVLTADWLNSLALGGPGATFTRDPLALRAFGPGLPTEVFTRVGETFIRLLRGEITWDAATSPAL